MEKLKQKLSSRKFWTAAVAYATSILTAFNVNHMNIEQVVAIIAGIGALAVYMPAEASVDKTRIEEEAKKD